MSASIHPSAIVDPKAELGSDVEIGPWAYVGPNCVVGDGCRIEMRATLEEHVILGPRVTVGVGTVLGGKPQDLKFKGEVTTVEIGEGTTLREYLTINRGTSHSMKTAVGKNCFLMSYVHLAHDCQLGDNIIISNGTQLAGHVTVDDRAIISGLCAVHQFAKIGRHAFIGGCSRISKDIPPFVKAVGNPVQLYGLNSVGLQRSGFKEDVVSELKKAYRLFFRSDLNITQALQKAGELKPFPEVQAFVEFVEASGRGVVT
ncbi:MAG TPA: acyl-ACP--UDP-N-acetylglucosamine O-acyltransferase [Gemmatimonadaceae bacterium]|nr:acyl-ACP--UDP-N-acetylglucosamine O-acyltransferase [Gemmatimonadaceae bacterium]HRQ78717.1 acyl-ACP--UDP-N-acetylglucosamine O-acyltransferase [Gemmatimonadaceae bacterium]